MFTVVGSLGVLLFFPLRKSDLLALEFGSSIVRKQGRWNLVPGNIRKTGEHVGTLVLPEEAGVLLDACLLGGQRHEHLPEAYRRAQGRPLLGSPRSRSAYSHSAFSMLFRRWTGVSPHLLRSLWCDEMVARGADRIAISAMLQHKTVISQKHYEILAGKIRMLRAAEALRKASNSPLSE